MSADADGALILGLIELAFRVVVLLILTVSMFGLIMVLMEEGISDVVTPSLWRKVSVDLS